eukprot:m.248434 g.248434  ORF g.248434 m.248434 type:complete len:125 (-) comp19505_c0_seq6:1503-1877(-)
MGHATFRELAQDLYSNNMECFASNTCTLGGLRCCRALTEPVVVLGMAASKGSRGNGAVPKNDHVDVAALKEKLKGHSAAKQKAMGKHATEYILDTPKKKSKKEKKEKTSEKQKKPKKSKKSVKE